jgi:predicted RNA-binding Zn-ribbon protein involved in translation (DUF1610 family)
VKARKASGRPDVKALHFCEIDRDLPIAGTPAPKPCPFCGKVDCSIVFNDDPKYPSAHVECDNCGVEGPSSGDEDDKARHGSYWRASEAARLWNERKKGAK